MTESRVEALMAKLQKGGQKTQEILGGLTAEQWQAVVYAEPSPWTVRDMLAHFLSAEEGLLRMTQDMASGRAGIPEGFDIETFNTEEQKRLADRSPQELLEALAAARQVTLDWVRTLDQDTLDRAGQHPVLGEISVEAMVTAIYGHQLMHMRDFARQTQR